MKGYKVYCCTLHIINVSKDTARAIRIQNMPIMNNLLVLFFALICLVNSEFLVRLHTSGTYSAQILSEIDQNVNYGIVVNNAIAASGQTLATSDTAWINFTAKRGDEVNINLSGITSSFSLYYVVNNAANGGGTEIYNSNSTTWTPVNPCTDQACEYEITGPDDYEQNKAEFYVNEVLVYTYEGGAGQSFIVGVGDLIRVDFTFNGENSQTGYGFGTEQAGYNYWFYNSFGESTRINNPALDRTPFGGFYSPITEEQVREFAVTVGSGKQNSAWIPLTHPNNA
jgi:hypothetical protein